MNAALQNFLDDPVLARQLGAELQQQLASAFRAVDDEANDNPDALTFLDCVTVIVEQPSSVAKRLFAIHELVRKKGRVVVSARELRALAAP